MILVCNSLFANKVMLRGMKDECKEGTQFNPSLVEFQPDLAIIEL